MSTFSRSLAARATSISDRVSQLERTALDPSLWQGGDSEKFRERSLRTFEAATAAVSQLHAFSSEISKQARQQEVASSADEVSTHSAVLNATARSSNTPSEPLTLEVGAEPTGDDGQRRDTRGDTFTPSNGSTAGAGADWDATHPAGPTWDEHVQGYRIGPPQRPDFQYDDDFPFESKKGQDSADDHVDLAAWKAKLHGAQLLRPDLDDSLALYEHYLGATGDAMTVDYDEAYREDPAIARNIDQEILASQAAAQQIINDGNDDFSYTGPPAGQGTYPQTENWQKTLGGYQQWSSGDVTVDESGHARMIITVHAEDQYNFNAGQADIASGAPDSENGRFSELGWAQGFNVTGSVQRVVEWDVENPADVSISKP